MTNCSLTFEVTLLSEAVFPVSAATLDVRTHHHLPGSVVFGLVASRAYDSGRWSAAVLDDFLHRRLRVTPAYPVASGGAASVPYPACWLREKSTPTLVDGDGLGGRVKSQLHDRLEHPKSVEGGFVSLDGRYLLPATAFRLKTAIDAEARGRVKEGSLFSYEVLKPGRRFRFSIRWEDAPKGFESFLVEEICDRCVKEICGRCAFGRSRGSEFGAAAIECIENAVPPTARGPVCEGAVVAYCASPLALRDPATGAPVLAPSSGQFGGLVGALRPRASSARAGFHVPYNAHRASHGLGRHIIEAGSVFVFDRVGDPPAEAWFGDFQYAGLGHVFFDPPFLAKDWLASAPSNFVSQDEVVFEDDAANADPGDAALFDWVRERANESSVGERAVRVAMELEKAYDAATDIVDGELPSAAQWHGVESEARAAVDFTDLRNRLFAGKKAFCRSRVGAKGWTCRLLREDKQLGEWFEQRVADHEEDPLVAKVVAEFARRRAKREARDGR